MIFRKLFTFAFLFVLLLASEPLLAQNELTCPHEMTETYDYLTNKFSNSLVEQEINSVEGLAVAESLSFGHIDFGDVDLPYLCSLTALKNLEIFNDSATSANKLTGKNLEYLGLLTNLERLDLDGNNIPATELFKLSPLKNLRSLQYAHGNPTGTFGWEALNALKSLEYLYLVNTALNSHALKWLENSTLSLANLNISGNPLIDNDSLAYLAKSKTIGMSIVGTGIQSSRNFELFNSSSSLEVLNLDEGAFLEGEFLLTVEKLNQSKLKELNLINLVDPELAKKISELPSLEKLTFSYDPLTVVPVLQNLDVEGVTVVLIVEMKDFPKSELIFKKCVEIQKELKNLKLSTTIRNLDFERQCYDPN